MSGLVYDNITLSGNLCNLCNFYILFLNNLNPFASVFSIVITKYIILDNLSQITRIVSFLATNSNLVIKSAIWYVYSFFGILISTFLLVSLSCSLFTDTYYTLLHTILHFSLLQAINNFLLLVLLSSICICVLLPCHMQAHLSGNYISTVISSLNYTSLPSTAATFLTTHLMVVLQPSRYSIFYGRDTPIQLSLLWWSYPC